MEQCGSGRENACKSSAVAHPVQCFIGHLSARDHVRLPRDSISVCLSPLETRATVEFGDFGLDEATMDGERLEGMDLEPVALVIDALRARARSALNFKAVIKNDFPLESVDASSSVFASLSLAVCEALGLDIELRELSRVAMLCVPSAGGSLTGYFSRFR